MGATRPRVESVGDLGTAFAGSHHGGFVVRVGPRLVGGDEPGTDARSCRAGFEHAPEGTGIGDPP
jgi:hypothetical protein